MLIRNFIFWLSGKKSITQAISKRGMRHGFARRFIAGETLAESLIACRELNRVGRRISLNHLGENVSSAEEAARVKSGYVEMACELDRQGLDGNVSIKLTQLGLDLKSGGNELCARLTAEIAAAADGMGRTIEIDMEGSAYTDATLEIFEATRRRYANVALAIQAYLYRSEKDLERLSALGPKIRLVKGAYREPAKIAFQTKADVDANYRRLLDVLLDGRFQAAIATHDPEILLYARRQLAERAVPPDRFEFQMIYGVRRDLQQRLCADNFPLRVYVPFGTEWCPYFMRRLSERPANCWFVLRSLMAESFGKSGTM